MLPTLTTNNIIERAMLLIRNHELFLNPLVENAAGEPIRITKIRNFDGFDANFKGLTLSIFPYSYKGTSNETTTSSNASMVFTDFHLGSGDGGFDKTCLNLVVTLKLASVDTKKTTDTVASAGTVEFERSVPESILYDWATHLRTILLSDPVVRLGGLINNSTVNWTSFRTTAWNDAPGKANGGDNVVFHQVSMLWQIYLNAPRNWRLYPKVGTGVGEDAGTGWYYLGIRTTDCTPMYWDSSAGVVSTLQGMPISHTPSGIPVKWDPVTQQYQNRDTGAVLTQAQLNLPGVTPAQPWIDGTLRLVGRLNGGYLLWNEVTQKLQDCSGTVVEEYDFDPDTGAVTPNPANPPAEDDELTVFGKGAISLYSANGMVLRDRFTL